MAPKGAPTKGAHPKGLVGRSPDGKGPRALPRAKTRHTAADPLRLWTFGDFLDTRTGCEVLGLVIKAISKKNKLLVLALRPHLDGCELEAEALELA